MGYTSLKHVCEQIDELGLLKCRAFDPEGETLGYTEQVDTEGMEDWVKALVRETDGRIKLELSSIPSARTKGSRAKPAPIEKLVCTVRGMRGVAPDPTREREEAKPAKPGDPPAPPVNLTYEEAKRIARMELELEYLKKERDELLEERTDDDDEEDDDDDQDERLPPAKHNPLSTLFGMSGDQAHEVLIGFGSILGKKVGAEPVNGAINGIGPKEQEMLRAFARFKAASPEQADGLITNLLDNFGDNPKPQPEDASKKSRKKTAE